VAGRKSYNQNCPIARGLDVLGERWTLLILRDAMYGLTRYDEFQRSLHIARNTLSDRLGKLVDAGVMTKRFYQDNPPRYEYLLTEMGRDFFLLGRQASLDLGSWPAVLAGPGTSK